MKLRQSVVGAVAVCALALSACGGTGGTTAPAATVDKDTKAELTHAIWDEK